jgi:hypothetical protein
VAKGFPQTAGFALAWTLFRFSKDGESDKFAFFFESLFSKANLFFHLKEFHFWGVAVHPTVFCHVFCDAGLLGVLPT